MERWRPTDGGLEVRRGGLGHAFHPPAGGPGGPPDATAAGGSGPVGRDLEQLGLEAERVEPLPPVERLPGRREPLLQRAPAHDPPRHAGSPAVSDGSNARGVAGVAPHPRSGDEAPRATRDHGARGTPVTKAEIEALIRRRAHEMWEREGRPEGVALRHWLDAERRVREEVAHAASLGNRPRTRGPGRRPIRPCGSDGSRPRPALICPAASRRVRPAELFGEVLRSDFSGASCDVARPSRLTSSTSCYSGPDRPALRRFSSKRSRSAAFRNG